MWKQQPRCRVKNVCLTGGWKQGVIFKGSDDDVVAIEGHGACEIILIICGRIVERVQQRSVAGIEQMRPTDPIIRRANKIRPSLISPAEPNLSLLGVVALGFVSYGKSDSGGSVKEVHLATILSSSIIAVISDQNLAALDRHKGPKVILNCGVGSLNV